MECYPSPQRYSLPSSHSSQHYEGARPCRSIQNPESEIENEDGGVGVTPKTVPNRATFLTPFSPMEAIKRSISQNRPVSCGKNDAPPIPGVPACLQPTGESHPDPLFRQESQDDHRGRKGGHMHPSPSPCPYSCSCSCSCSCSSVAAPRLYPKFQLTLPIMFGTFRGNSGIRDRHILFGGRR